MTFIFIFIILSIINVIFSTVRSITTIKSGKLVAGLISGGYYAFYNIMLLYTVADFPMWQKCVITFGCNVLGVYIVKLIEQKLRKDRLWRIEFTVNNIREDTNEIKDLLDMKSIPFSYQDLGKHTLFTCYAETQLDSTKVKNIIDRFNGKYFASETKIL